MIATRTFCRACIDGNHSACSEISVESDVKRAKCFCDCHDCCHDNADAIKDRIEHRQGNDYEIRWEMSCPDCSEVYWSDWEPHYKEAP